MGTLAIAKRKLVSGSKHRGRFCGFRGDHPHEKFWDCIWKMMQYSAFLAGKWHAMPSIMRSNHKNAVPIRSDSFSTNWTALPRAPLEMTPVGERMTEEMGLLAFTEKQPVTAPTWPSAAESCTMFLITSRLYIASEKVTYRIKTTADISRFLNFVVCRMHHTGKLFINVRLYFGRQCDNDRGK